MTPHQQIQSNISELQQALLSSHPLIPSLLKRIHDAIKADPDCVTLLQPEEVGVIVNGLERQTGIYIADSITSKGKGASLKGKDSKQVADLLGLD